MQDDITDVVKYLTSEGAADPDRICIAGGSYGAYSALMGVIRDPDLYRCAVGIAGVYDLPLLFKSGDIPKVLSGVNYLKKAVGENKADMEERSPVNNAHRIKVPVFLVHGRLDERAPIEHAHRLRKALKRDQAGRQSGQQC